MSLSKATTKVKAGVKELQSPAGLKRVFVYGGLGFAIGSIISLVLTYIMEHFVYPYLKENAEDPATWTKPYAVTGYEIFPDAKGITWDSIILIIITVMMLFSKKFWLTTGFFLGWYFSRYLGLYTSLGLETIGE